jgi:hypothetical protein
MRPFSKRRSKSVFFLNDWRGLFTTHCNRQSLTPFSSSSRKDFLTRFSSHTCAKSVCGFTTTLRWLICSFHVLLLIHLSQLPPTGSSHIGSPNCCFGQLTLESTWRSMTPTITLRKNPDRDWVYSNCLHFVSQKLSARFI